MSADNLDVVVLRAYAESIDWITGVTKNAQTHRVFLRGASLGMPTEIALTIAREFVLRNSGKLSLRDLKHQCTTAYAHVAGRTPAEIDLSRFTRDSKGNLVPIPNLSAAFNRTTLAEYAARFGGEVTTEYLRDRSTSWPLSWHSFLRGLFPEQVVLVYNDMKARLPMRLNAPCSDTLSGPYGIWFLSNAVDGRSHVNLEGKHSWRSKEAVRDYRHLVLECDKDGQGVAEDWLRFLVLLPMPIRAIYTSGGKSVHALVALNAASKQDWDATVAPLKRKLAECGADPGAMTAVRLTRLPYCFRESTRRWQELLYYRPDADATPITKFKGVA
jgi:hypothetical protein